jgi:hypothetical protein
LLFIEDFKVCVQVKAYDIDNLINKTMKVDRELFNVSFRDIFWYFFFQFVLINSFAFGYSVIKGTPTFLLYDAALLIQVVFAIVNAVLIGMINRNGMLRISGYSDIDFIKDKIECVMMMKRLEKKEICNGHFIYSKYPNKSMIYRFFFNEELEIKYADDSIEIFGKRNTFRTLEIKLRFDKNINP